MGTLWMENCLLGIAERDYSPKGWLGGSGGGTGRKHEPGNTPVKEPNATTSSVPFNRISSPPPFVLRFETGARSRSLSSFSFERDRFNGTRTSRRPPFRLNLRIDEPALERQPSRGLITFLRRDPVLLAIHRSEKTRRCPKRDRSYPFLYLSTNYDNDRLLHLYGEDSLIDREESNRLLIFSR